MKSLFNQKIANDFVKLTALIANVEEYLSANTNFKIKPDRWEDWTGFEINIESKKSKYFFGIWFDIWKSSGCPFVLSIRLSDDLKPNLTKEIYRNFFYKNKKAFSEFKVFDENYCLSFSYEFILSSKPDVIAKKIIEVSNL